MEYKVPCDMNLLFKLRKDYVNDSLDTICAKIKCTHKYEMYDNCNGLGVYGMTFAFTNQTDYTMLVMRYC